MAHPLFSYVIMATILAGGVLLVLNNERIRCVVAQSCGPAAPVAPPEEFESIAATTTAVATTTPINAVPVAPKQVPAAAIAPKPISPPPPTVVTTVVTVTAEPILAKEGPTTFSVSAIPLLAGGMVRGGETVPISYLKIVNRGSYAARLKGFWVRQNGNAPTRAIIGLATIDDKGGSRGQTGGAEGSTPFNDGVAFAPTDALIQPGQTRLFTIKAIMKADISDYVGTELKIDVTALQAKDVTFKGAFPIRGTTWTLSN